MNFPTQMSTTNPHQSYCVSKSPPLSQTTSAFAWSHHDLLYRSRPASGHVTRLEQKALANDIPAIISILIYSNVEYI